MSKYFQLDDKVYRITDKQLTELKEIYYKNGHNELTQHLNKFPEIYLKKKVLKIDFGIAT